MFLSIRPEQPADAVAIRRVLEAAFPTAAEARLVELLRAGDHLGISLVAEWDEEIVGHIAFSPVEMDGVAGEGIGVGLAPVAFIRATNIKASAADSSARVWQLAGARTMVSSSCWGSRRTINASASPEPTPGTGE